MTIPRTVLDAITARPKPLAIGVSGFGGAGKSTIANALSESLNAPVIGTDSFFKNNTDQSYHLWEIIDWERLRVEVIDPFKEHHPAIRYRAFDWHTGTLGEMRQVVHEGIIILEGVGLFRPELNQDIGYKIWVGCSLEKATERGKRRDRDAYNHPNDELWDGIWKQNDEEYIAAYDPQGEADVVINTD